MYSLSPLITLYVVYEHSLGSIPSLILSLINYAKTKDPGWVTNGGVRQVIYTRYPASYIG